MPTDENKGTEEGVEVECSNCAVVGVKAGITWCGFNGDRIEDVRSPPCRGEEFISSTSLWHLVNLGLLSWTDLEKKLVSYDELKGVVDC